MKSQNGIDLPPSFTDLAFLLMFIFLLITMALATEARKEFQTQVDLLKHRTVDGNGAGSEQMSLAITKKGGKYLFVLESKKIGSKQFPDLTSAITELKQLHPPEIIIRADQDAPWKYPHQIMIESSGVGILVGVAAKEEV